MIKPLPEDLFFQISTLYNSSQDSRLCMVLILSTWRSYSHFKHRDHGTHNSLPPKLVQIPSWGQDLPCPHHPHSSDHPLDIYSSLMHCLQLRKQARTLNDCNINHNDNKEAPSRCQNKRARRACTCLSVQKGYVWLGLLCTPIAAYQSDKQWVNTRRKECEDETAEAIKIRCCCLS